MTEPILSFQKITGAHLTQEEIEVLTLALEQPYINLTDIRSLGINTTQQARDIANTLVAHNLLKPATPISFEISEALRDHSKRVTPQVKLLIMHLSGEMGRQDIMNKLQLKDRHHFSENYLQPALDSGFVEMTLPDKPRSSKQRYRLTESGKTLQTSLVKSI